MKKTFTINLGGKVLNIDDDALESLQQYINALKAHYSKGEDGEEIMYDIESRLAELFIENLKQENRESVSIPDVEQAISIMGKPEDIFDEEAPRKLPNNKRLARKRLYPENCSGTRKTASWEAWPPGSPRTWEFRSPSHVYVSC